MVKTMLTKACARFRPRIEAVIDAEGDSSSEVCSTGHHQSPQFQASIQCTDFCQKINVLCGAHIVFIYRRHPVAINDYHLTIINIQQ